MCAQGERDFEKICCSCFDDVYSYVAFRVAPDAEAASDITQEVFLAALKALPDFQGEGSPLAWLRAIARHKVGDYFRARKALPDPPADSQLGVVVGGWSKHQQEALLVSQVLRRLPANYAELLEEKYLDEASVREIARRRNMSEKAVESALSRARDAFRKAFERLYIKEELLP